MVENGKVISVHYTGKLKSGEVFDSSEGKEPLTFQVGTNQIIPGFEKALIGKNVNDEVIIEVTSEDAYGPVREDLYLKVDKDKMPDGVSVGQTLQAQADNGQEVNVLVEEIHDDHVIINGNHPLAGEDLVFDVKIMNIED